MFFIDVVLIVLEIAMLITGLMALILGQFPYRQGRPVTGYPAYISGVIMCLPIAVALPVGLSMTQGESWAEGYGKRLVLHVCFIVGCAALAYLLAALLYNPDGGMARKKWLQEVEKRRGRRRNRDEEDEDRPRKRRRRRRDADDLDDRPRGRPRDEEDDFEDRPRRRPRDEEDEMDPRPPRRSREEIDGEDAPRSRYAEEDDDRNSYRSGPPPLPRD